MSKQPTPRSDQLRAMREAQAKGAAIQRPSKQELRERMAAVTKPADPPPAEQQENADMAKKKLKPKKKGSAKPARKAAGAKKARKATKAAPKAKRARKAVPQAADGKVNNETRLIGILQQSGGATQDDICKEFNWLPHTARAAVSRLVTKGMDVQKIKDKDRGGTVYSIAA